MAATDKTTVPKLVGTNYATWRLQCKMALMKEGLWAIVDGSEHCPNVRDDGIMFTEYDVRKFRARKDKALATIVLSVHESQLYLLGSEPEDPTEVWQLLCDQFQKRTWANKLALRRKLNSMKMKRRGSVQKHMKSMMELFQELAIIGEAVEEEDKVVQLLASLPEQYDTLVTALESSSEVPAMDTVTERLIHEERKIKNREESHEVERGRALYAGGSNKKNFHKQQKKSGPTCYNCGKVGHVARNCKSKDKKSDDGRKFQSRGAANVLNHQSDEESEESSSDSECGFVVESIESDVPTEGEPSEEVTKSNVSSEGEVPKTDMPSEGEVVDCDVPSEGEAAMSTSSKKQRGKWLIDSGASSHMNSDKNDFKKLVYYDEPKKVKVGDGKYVEALGEGTIDLEVRIGSKVKIRRLKNVLYVPSLAYSLLSVGKATTAGLTVSFANNMCTITDTKRKIIAVGNKAGDLYFLDYVVESANLVTTGSEKKQVLWHKRFGHISYSSLNKLVRDNLVTGMDYTISNEPLFCKPCIDGKHHRSKFPKGGAKRASQTLELVHSDVCGKMGAKSLSGKEYFVTLIDDKSRFMWTFALKFKSDVFEVFLNWKSMVEKSTEKKLKSLRSDNGGEYISTEFEDYLKKEGIAHQSSIPKTPEQNGVAERKNRTIVEAIRSLLSDSNLPKSFWAEALATVTYLNNISPTKAVENFTPYEVWYERKPSVDHLKTFGCVCYSHIPKDERRKLDFKAREAIFLGYGTTVKGYRLYDPKSKRIFYSRDVIFDESKFKSSRNDPQKVEGAEEKV